ncbi:MAG TPA: PDZ domain-containing protein [Opitutaceae bacterium]|nr:PDZ domain-containing protein [Opitutaceae bacterium]
MKVRRIVAALILVLPVAAGWAAAPAHAAPSSDAQVERLSPFFVRETRISNFGLSIVTNFGVIWGGKIKWMRVGQVAPGSAAAEAHLNPDDEIFMINGRPRSGMSRDTMLGIFFERRLGDTVSLELRDSRTRLLRLVVLTVNAKGLESGAGAH